MEKCILLVLACMAFTSSAWSIPYYPVPRAPLRVVRYAVPPHQHHAPAPSHHRIPVPAVHEPIREDTSENDPPQWQRPKRGHDYDSDHHRDHRGSSGITGPVHTFVKTDKNANYKWGVRHHVGDKFSS